VAAALLRMDADRRAVGLGASVRRVLATAVEGQVAGGHRGSTPAASARWISNARPYLFLSALTIWVPRPASSAGSASRIDLAELRGVQLHLSGVAELTELGGLLRAHPALGGLVHLYPMIGLFGARLRRIDRTSRSPCPVVGGGECQQRAKSSHPAARR